MPWYLYLALKQLFPTGRRFPFFTAISILGVTLGVALLLISTSVMAGFGYEIRKMIVETQGDVQVQGVNQVIGAPEDLQKVVNGVAGVEASSPFAVGPVLLIHDNKAAFPAVAGVDLNQVEKVLPNLFKSYVHPAGVLDRLDDDSIVLSIQLADTIGAKIGDEVEIWSPRQAQDIGGDTLRFPHVLRVAGIFQIGHQHLDSSVVLVTLRAMQDIYDLGSGVHGVYVRIAPGEDADAVADRINAALPPALGAEAHSWIENNQDFLFVLQLEKNMISFLLLFIIVVAAFSVTSSLLISVVRKTREIGLLGALGASPRQVAACFCFQGLLIGTAGTLAGLGLGYAALHYRENIVALFARLTQSESVLQRFYQFSNLPSYTDPADVVRIVVASVLISTLAGLLPAWRAARLKPVEALRSE